MFGVLLSSLAILTIVFQCLVHYRWWLNLWLSVKQNLFFKHCEYDKEVHIAEDNEKYTIWWPKRKNKDDSSNSNSNSNSKSNHLWICVPGAMKSLSETMQVLNENDCFKNSDWCVFNQPGISDIPVVNKPTPPPTDPIYLFEFILKIKNYNKNNNTNNNTNTITNQSNQSTKEENINSNTSNECNLKDNINVNSSCNNNNSNNNSKMRYYDKISVIGFSMGGTGSLFLIDKLESYKSKSLVNQILCVHSPELIRETFEHLHNNWFFRFDIACALHVYNINKLSKSWSLINTKMSNVNWYNGWPFMKRISEVIINSNWNELEYKWYNPRRIIEKNKIKCVDLIRIISKHDPIVPINTIDKKLFKNYYKVEIHDNSGHCYCSNQLIKSIKYYNQRMINNNEK